MIQNFVISVKTATKRREHIMCEFGKQGIAFEFFDAVTPADITKYAQKLSIPIINNQRLTDGEKACFLSHVSLWQQMIDENLDYMAIFEDDVYLGNDSQQFLQELTIWLQQNAVDVIKLETWEEKIHIKKAVTVLNHRQLCPLKTFHTGTAGYVISQQGAKIILDYLSTLDAFEFFPIDHVIFDAIISKMSVLQVNPAMVIQAHLVSEDDTFKSLIETQRKQNVNQHRRRTLADYGKKYYRSIGKRTFFQIIAFH